MNHAQGIIIADDIKQQKLFSTADRSTIIGFATNISKEYNQAIIHLGRSHVFEEGNIFSSELSQKNLVLFCEELKKNNVKVFLWFFDSYGAAGFNKLYQSHKSIIDDNLTGIEKLNIPYDGIAIDMEWINKGGSGNNRKYVEIIKYLRNRINDKIIYCFASLVNSEETNRSRGYDVNKILDYADNIIDLLYLQDADFFIFSDDKRPELNVTRIKDLMNYFKKENLLLAISLQGGLVMQKKTKNGFTLIPELEGGFEEFFSKAKLKQSSKNEFSEVYEYKIKRHRSFKLKNGEKIHFRRKQLIYYFKLNAKKLVSPGDFIWEYFLLNRDFS